MNSTRIGVSISRLWPAMHFVASACSLGATPPASELKVPRLLLGGRYGNERLLPASDTESSPCGMSGGCIHACTPQGAGNFPYSP